jgi:hypothetical protein
VRVDPRGVDCRVVQLAGSGNGRRLTGSGTDRALERFPVSGRIETVVLRQGRWTPTAFAWKRWTAPSRGRRRSPTLSRPRGGEVTGFDVREMLRVYNGQTVPWDGAASGPLDLTVTLQHSDSLRLPPTWRFRRLGTALPYTARSMLLTTASRNPGFGPLVSGAARSTRLDFSGVLGRQLRVRADSRNLDEVLPAFDVPSLPVKLQKGEAAFDGSVAGKLDDPRIAGHGSATNVVWSGKTFDALSGDIDLTSAGFAVRNGSVQRGTLRAQGAGSLGMRDWTVEDASPLVPVGFHPQRSGRRSDGHRGCQERSLQGTIDADRQRSREPFGDPALDAAITATKGTLDGEPFTRFTGALNYSAEPSDGQRATGGGRQTDRHMQAHYQHQAGAFGNGQLRFQVDSNPCRWASFRS